MDRTDRQRAGQGHWRSDLRETYDGLGARAVRRPGNLARLGQVRQDFYDYFYGGYIEVSGFGPGPHTLRAESLGIDYRPVTIALFGISTDGQVVP